MARLRRKGQPQLAFSRQDRLRLSRAARFGETERVGVVVIGRNEGQRLGACLNSLRTSRPLVYVDSGSTDGSQALAAAHADRVIELDPAVPFSAGRARNAGVEALLAIDPGLAFIQTVDGDCTVDSHWLDDGRRFLVSEPSAAVVFGRRRERFADRNAYHRAADDEWATPIGTVSSCGGDAMFRVTAFHAAKGFNPALIAGEEPDLCLRLRAEGWTVQSNGAEMTLHDIDMSNVTQWWQRSRRAGFAFAQLVHIHGPKAEPAWSRLVWSAAAWTLVMILSAFALLVGAVIGSTRSMIIGEALTVLIAVQFVRLATKKHLQMGGWLRALIWAGLLMIGKLAEATGAVEFHLRRQSGKRTTIMEYKDSK